MSSAEDLIKALTDSIGDNHEKSVVKNYINTGYAPLNHIISGRYDGGIPGGRMGEMYGDSSTGKTALATMLMICAQKMGGVAIFVDWEKTFNADMGQIMGLNVDRPYFIYVKPRTWEEGNILASKAAKVIRASKAIPENAPILSVYDSIAAALPQSTVWDSKGKEREIDEMSMNDTTALSRVTSTTLKTQAYWCDELDAAMLYLNQTRTKPGVVYGDPTTTPGGKAMEFYSTWRLSLARAKIMEQKAGEKTFVGQEITMKCVKSKLTAPFKEASLRLSFDDLGMARFDVTRSLIDVLASEGHLKAGTTTGSVIWHGKQYAKGVLAKMIDAEAKQGELKDLALSKLAA